MQKKSNSRTMPALSAATLLLSTVMVSPVLADTYNSYYTSDTGTQQIAPPTIITQDPQTSSNFSKVLADLPSYSHNAAIDEKPHSDVQLDALDPITPKPKDFGVNTRSGFDVGVQVSNYHYREPDLDVSLSGFKGGVTIDMTGKIYTDYFIRGDFRYSAGASDYSSWATVGNGEVNSGRNHGLYEGLWDIRGLFGRDFIMSNYDISPYIGFAFRNLYSDDRGLTSLGAGGYRRNNNLFYFPVGFTQRVLMTDTDRLSVTLEYDQVILGVQTSYLSDVGGGAPDLTNLQHSGRGMRGEIMWEIPSWSFGPFADYWNIDSSSVKSACGPGQCVIGGYEPHNHTIEAGVQLKYHFFGF